MSEVENSEASTSDVKPVLDEDDAKMVKFPPFPGSEDLDFDCDISPEEQKFYEDKFTDLNTISTYKLHCTACDRHLGSAPRNENKMRTHPLLKTLVCHTCHTFYNSGEFDKGDDGSELYCRWCGQGGQVYCCSGCPHVFCAKCIKRNLGPAKIKEIEETDDWKCFKCNNKCLWELRSICWALLRYCDWKNKITHKTEDKNLKQEYLKDCNIDQTTCCKAKRRKEKIEKKKENDILAKKSATAAVISKIPPTIQVKKFASINLDDTPKKPVKRSISPNQQGKLIIKSPINIAPKMVNPCMNMTGKRMKISMPTNISNNIRFSNERRPQSYVPRLRKLPQPPIQIISPSQFNGFNNMMFSNINSSDNINLSLESLTQGLDMAAVSSINQGGMNEDDLVCTPDFPMEPLCEVTEDNTDDDVQCITPSQSTIRVSAPPPLVPRLKQLPDLSPENIVQMTENDVTVNAVTGGLKFRVDPQTLSSNKMYRLPDGRIFAINSNPNMPGGYSATIVAIAETSTSKQPSRGATYAAKLNPVVTPITKQNKNSNKNTNSKQRNKNKKSNNSPDKQKHKRQYDLNVPVEWYRFNLIDAVDALDYSMNRLNSLKKEATTMHLRTRSVDEMRELHKTLERLLNTSSSRFKEIRENLNKGFKQYLIKKMGCGEDEISEDDDVEILGEENNDPIYIDENSMESNTDDLSVIENQEVDLTEQANSEQNDSIEKSINKGDDPLSLDKDSHLRKRLEGQENNVLTDNANDSSDIIDEELKKDDEHNTLENDQTVTAIDSILNESGVEQECDSQKDSRDKIECDSKNESNDKMECDPKDEPDDVTECNLKENSIEKSDSTNLQVADDKSPLKTQNGDIEIKEEEIEKISESENNINDKNIVDNKCDSSKKNSDENKNADVNDTENKSQDSELSDETIENLLKGDDETQKTNHIKIGEIV